MYDLLLKNARLEDGSLRDLAIQGGRFARIAPSLEESARESFDCRGMTLLPPFYNGHTHVAMVLLRGYADDLPLFPWLQEHIWPAEARLTPEDVAAGVRLAILEMIKGGTVYFNDSYFHLPETIQAVEEMGVRATIGLFYLDLGQEGPRERLRRQNQEVLQRWKRGHSSRVGLSLNPHAIYTVPEKVLREMGEQARAEGLPIHIHLAETEKEFQDCQREHHGKTPFQYAYDCGLLTERSYLAHCVWMTDDDRRLAAETGAILVANTTSNLKLCSGIFDFRAAEQAGCRIALGTDGCASNNAHSMFSEMKFAALAGKCRYGDPTACPAEKVFSWATEAGAAFVEGAGRIQEGALADAMLLDLDQPYLVGDYHLRSNLVYAGESSCVDSLLCDGHFLMRHRSVPGEGKILADARRVCDKLRKLKEDAR